MQGKNLAHTVRNLFIWFLLFSVYFFSFYATMASVQKKEDLAWQRSDGLYGMVRMAAFGLSRTSSVPVRNRKQNKN